MNNNKKLVATLAVLALAVAFLTLVKPAVAGSRKPLKNQDVVQMVKAGFDQQTVIKAIQANPTDFDVSPEALLALKKGGVSQQIIQAMLTSAAHEQSAGERSAAPANAAPGAAGEPSAPAANPNDPRSPHDPGIYLERTQRNKSVMEELQPSTYSRGKAAGLFASAMTMGISKAKWKIVVRGKRAALRIPESAPQFWFYFRNSGSEFSSGPSSPDDFLLVKLEKHGSDRELVVEKVGSFGASSGVPTKDTFTLASKRIAPGIYEARPSTPLKPGEYAFLPAGEKLGRSSEGGKLFDFEVDAAR